MSERVVILARTRAHGLDEAREAGITPVAIVTPRTLSAAYGVNADRIHVSESLTARESDALMTAVAPCLATSPQKI